MPTLAGSSTDDGQLPLGGNDVVETNVQIAKVPTAPIGPSPAEIEAHNVTHLPYRSWCRWCVMSRKPNPKHMRNHYSTRDVPMLVGDYAFIRDSRDEDLLTVFIGCMYPSKSIVVIPCEQKGDDPYAVNRLANFIKTCGALKIVHMSDQESPLRTLFENAISLAGATGELVEAVPERSAVGESQSNGRPNERSKRQKITSGPSSLLWKSASTADWAHRARS